MGPMPATAPFCPSSLPSPPLPFKSYGLGFGGGQRKELRTEPLASTQQGVIIMSCSWKISPLEHSQRSAQRPDWSGIGAGLHDPNSKEGCKMGPLGFGLGVCKSPDGRVKSRGSSCPRYHPVWGPHSNDVLLGSASVNEHLLCARSSDTHPEGYPEV